MRKSLSVWAFVLGLVVVLTVAAAVRLYGLNWDAGTHLHPDERYLTMVVSAVRFPGEAIVGQGGEQQPSCEGLVACTRLYWDTARSPLNPATYDEFATYVYGTLPLFVTRAAARWADTACAVPSPALPRLYRAWVLGDTAPCFVGHYKGYGGIHLVGRSLSTLSDLFTVLGLVLLAKALVGRKTALVAGLLYALAVLPVQHAHFFVVDSFATVFVMWTLTFVVLATTHRRSWLLIPAGIATGLAVASKISVWPLAAIVGLAGVVRVQRPAEGREGIGSQQAAGATLQLTVANLAVLVLAGVGAALVFRAAQPYAFTGPGFFGLRLNPGWVDTMRNIRDLMSGLQDVPYGHQWTARTPIVFPWRNMVFWGLGLPLGLASWVGWGWLGIDLMRGRHRHLLVWLWGTGFFLYQATQWVKSMRYLLPVYPMFVLFAAIALGRIYQYSRRLRGSRARVEAPVGAGLTVSAAGATAESEPGFGLLRDTGMPPAAGPVPAWRRAVGAVVVALPWAVLVGTALWCVAFLGIYSRPLTRVAASAWLYEHIPTAVVLQTPDGPVNVAWGPNLTLGDSQSTVSTTFVAQEPMVITGLYMPKVTADTVSEGRIVSVDIGEQTLTQQVRLPSLNPISISYALGDPIPLEAGETLDISVSLLEGPAVTLKAAVIANEHWDDPLPLRMDGKDAFWNWYQGLSSSPSGQMNNYDEDTVQKRFSLLAWLSETDYIVLSSNRLYASIPRLAQRYPLTTAYYRHLFDGSLGFELVARFDSFPRLGPCTFPDQEMPFVLAADAGAATSACSIALPPAEEAFSVYDHPSVFVFRKSPTFSVAEAERLLPRSLVDQARWMTPLQATKAPLTVDEDALLLSPRMRAAQEAGGTWSRLFNTSAIQNTSERVAIVLWALMVTLLGWIAFPLIYRLFPALACRGYGLARITGLLIWAYLAWLLASLRVLPYTPPVLWGLVLAMAGLSGWVAWRRRSELRILIAGQWRTIVLVDTIFLTLFLVWVGVRWLNPDLWHPVVGGEKPMDFAYFNAVIKSTWFPPYDPWFAGGQLNYYYFGFVMMGALTQVLGIAPNVAYNLAVPTLFALAGVGGYVLASNLAGGDDARRRRAGLWGVATVVLLGNLGEVRLIAKGLSDVGQVSFESLIPGYPQAVSALVGLWKVVVQGAALPFRPEWWYWDPTRIIPVDPGEVGPINEFPAFTFLYADLHAHAMALPLTQVALAVAIQWALGAGRPGVTRDGGTGGDGPWWRKALGWALPTPAGSIVLGGLVAGALRATNTWDYPTYLALMSVGFLIGLLSSAVGGGGLAAGGARSGHALWDKRLLLGLVTPVVLLGSAELLFRPFTASYRVPYAAFELWPGSRTPLATYLLMYGPFLFPIAVGAGAGLIRNTRAIVVPAGDVENAAGWSAEEPSSSGTLQTLGRLRHGRWVEPVLWLIVTMLVLAVILVILVGYFEAPIAWLAVVLGAAAAALVVAPAVSLRRRLLWFWVGTALALSLLVEVAVLKGDIGRMNTVFKFHLQVWMLLALAGAVFIERLLHRTGIQTAGSRRGQERSEQAIELEQPGGVPQLGDPADSSAGVGVSVSWRSLLSDGVVLVMALLVLGAVLYPTFAIPAKARDRWVPAAPHSLDGMAFMRSAVQYENGAEIRTEADYWVIRWLQENVVGSPTIIEGLGEREYLWGNRISIYTGLPTVVGWRWHQVQQRMVMPAGTVEGRQQDVRLFYSTTSSEIAQAILDKYQVSYVILGPYERAYMLAEGLPKFNDMVATGRLEVVYQDADSTIYHVVR